MPAGIAANAAVLKERIARAKQTLPNGYCGIPIQSKCPHPNACLSCDAFLTPTSRFGRFSPSSAPAPDSSRQRRRRRPGARCRDQRRRRRARRRSHGLDELASAQAADESFDIRELGAA